MDHGGGQPGAVATIAVIDPLDHLFAALVLEVHVDIGWLATFLRDEALEDEGDGLGRHFGDAKEIADNGIGGRAAALAENALRAGEGHDVMDGQEIGRIVHRADECQFLLDPVTKVVG